MNITPDEERRLKTAKAAFLKKLHGTPEQHRRAVVTAAAHGFGQEKTDPFVKAIANHMLKVYRANEKIEAMQAELAELEKADLTGHRPGDPHYRGRILARKADLEETIKGEMARVVGIANSDFAKEKQEAVEAYRSDDAKRAKAEAIMAEVDRLRAEQDRAEITKRASAILAGERTAASDS